MHWGHARSRDLVNWEHLPIALWPSLEKGEEHVFSGGATIGPDGGRASSTRASASAIRSSGWPSRWMTSWSLGEVRAQSGGHAEESRRVDGGRVARPLPVPRGWAHLHGLRRQHQREAGRRWHRSVIRGRRPSLTEWRHRGVAFEYRDRPVWNIECPNLFKLGSKWVLLISPQDPCEYFVGSLDLARGKFPPDTHGVLDPGRSYASNISYDDRAGRFCGCGAKPSPIPPKAGSAA